MSGRATLEIRLSATRISLSQRGPVAIGQLVPALLEQYGLGGSQHKVQLRQVQRAAAQLGQQSLSRLSDVS